MQSSVHEVKNEVEKNGRRGRVRGFHSLKPICTSSPESNKSKTVYLRSWLMLDGCVYVCALMSRKNEREFEIEGDKEEGKQKIEIG